MGGRRVKKITGEKAKEPVKKKPEKKSATTEAQKGKPRRLWVEAPTGASEETRKKLSPPRRTKSAPARPAGGSGGKTRGKRYQAAKEKIEGGKPASLAGRLYPLSEAVKIVKESSYANFDASVEAHINLGLEAGKTEHRIRTLVALPHGTGKKVKVLVFAKGKEAKAASETGADRIGDEEMIEKIAKSGKAAFDAVVATPEFMPKLAKIARILGPQGLMPSPKSGTVTDKPAEVVIELKKGRVELKTEKQPIIHTVIGKVSFPEKKLIENLRAIVEELNRVRPTKVKGEYIRSAYLKSTMAPSIKVNLASKKDTPVTT